MKPALLITAILLSACGKNEPAKPTQEPKKPTKKPPSQELQMELDTALRNADLEKAKELVAKGADVNFPDEDGNRLIHAVCNPYVYRDPLAAARFLKTQGADLTAQGPERWPPIAQAVWWNQTKLMDFFEENGADLKEKFPGPIPRSTPGYTLLHVASVRIDVFALQWLLPKGLDVNSTNDLGETALLLAAEKGNDRAVKLLLAAGADKSITNKKGELPLALAQKGIERWKTDAVNRVSYEKTVALLKG